MGCEVSSIEKGKNGTRYVVNLFSVSLYLTFVSDFPNYVIFSVDAATRQGFVISQTLLDVKGYTVRNQNPILECIVDQMDHDEQRSGEKLTGLALRDEIIHALTQNTIEWPQQANKIITKEEWIRLMKIDPAFYLEQSRSAQEMKDREEILLDLASKYLKRKITLIPFLEGGQEQAFFPNFSEFQARNSDASKASSYHLLCCNKAISKNFFISIFRK